MKKTFQFSYIQYDSLDKAPKEIQSLMAKAQEVREKAHAPYSKFLVGAAILDSEGNVYVGNNQENAAYPSGLCAERVAIFHAGAINPNAIFTDLAVTVRSLNKKIDYPTSPCGACRQSLAEYETKQKQGIRIHFMGEEGPIVQVDSIKDLLPFLFDGSSLI
ncbi:MAG TPA: cytidine deaminase [Flavobacteriaceae bacterium]|nr:cytidine deaminase [Flavobacteriaceae bacterium]